MKIKRFFAFVLSLVMIFSAVVFSSSAKEETSLPLSEGIENLQQQFQKGVGPEIDGYAIDYRYYSLVGQDDTTKYPLVIWLHGMGDGATEGLQVTKSDIAYWSSAEFQSRFTGSEGAYILAPRSVEEEGLYWSNSLIYPLRAAIDGFIAENKDSIDVSRIYIGGYSMGGKMTLKMTVAYPEMFAAAFPICPAWTPGVEQTALISDMPVWMTSGALDPLVNYFTSVKPTWDSIIAVSNVAESCRFSTLRRTAYPSGLPTASSHHSWFAVNNDMFAEDNGNYPAMTTVDGMGNEVTLTYPNGMISWLSSFTSDYDGAAATDSGNVEAQSDGESRTIFETVRDLIKNLLAYILSFFS